MDSNGHLCHSLVKMSRLLEVRCSSTWINFKSNFTKTNFKKMDPWLPFRCLTDSFSNSSIHNLLWIMADKYFVEYTRIETHESKVDTGKALDVALVVMESSGTESGKQDTSSMSGNDIYVDNADIKPVYDKEPMAKVQLTTECNVFAIGQQHTEKPEFNNEGGVD
ncbi:hypothetical protein Tco_0757518 [Tanacetum coccineum]